MGTLEDSDDLGLPIHGGRPSRTSARVTCLLKSTIDIVFLSSLLYTILAFTTACDAVFQKIVGATTSSIFCLDLGLHKAGQLCRLLPYFGCSLLDRGQGNSSFEQTFLALCTQDSSVP